MTRKFQILFFASLLILTKVVLFDILKFDFTTGTRRRLVHLELGEIRKDRRFVFIDLGIY
jgi:hypothetical protein